MLIDWFTVVAQIVNFLILVLLLRRFLYGPIVRAMKEREARIAARLDEAARERAEAEREANVYRQRQAALEAQWAEMLRGAEEEAETRRRELLRQAREDVSATQTRWYATVEREKAAFLRNLRRRAGEEITAVARRALADLADVDLERQMAQVFVGRLRTLDGTAWETIAAATRGTAQPIVVTSAFELSEDARGQIRAAVAERLANGAAPEFTVDARLVGGIEMKTPGYVVAWGLDTYLGVLETRIGELLDDEAQRPGGEDHNAGRVSHVEAQPG